MNITKIIEFLISGVIIVRGVYYAYAFFNPNIDDMILIEAVGYPYILLVIGMIMILPGIVTMLGNVVDKMWLKDIGLFLMSICFLFITTLHIVAATTVVTTRPFSWIYPLALALIAGAVWVENRTNQRLKS